MSQPQAASKTKKEKTPKKVVPTDRYTFLLLISTVALIVGCVALYLEVASHGPKPVDGMPSATLFRAASALEPLFAALPSAVSCFR